ncbi:DNA/RNA polymerases superfamily protein [Tanacetum coccineum]
MSNKKLFMITRYSISDPCQDRSTFTSVSGKCLQNAGDQSQEMSCTNFLGPGRERILEGPEMIEVTNEKVVVAREKLKELIHVRRVTPTHRRALEFHPKVTSIILYVVSYPFDQIREDLSYTEEPESILDRQDRVMRNKTIPFVKILWRNHPEREATWETEESIRTSYPHFLP